MIPPTLLTFLILILCLLQTIVVNAQNVPAECLPSVPPTQVAPVTGPGAADIIFFIDTSGSMGDESDLVIQNLNAFGQHLEDEGIDYRLILVGDDRSCCRLCVNPPLSASSCAITGPKFLKVEEYIGSTDALDRTLNSAVYNKYSTFLRANAAKTIVYVSDDKIQGNYRCIFENTAPCKIATANRFFADLHVLDQTNQFFAPTPKLPHGVMIHSIDGHTCCSPREPGCGYSYTYQGLAEVTGGTNFVLCNDNWSTYFSTIAGAVAATTGMFVIIFFSRVSFIKELFDTSGD